MKDTDMSATEADATKSTKHEENWQANFLALKAHVEKTGHFPNKHTTLNNWVRYQRKRMKAGLMTEEQERLFLELSAMRSHEHTGGRKKGTSYSRNEA